MQLRLVARLVLAVASLHAWPVEGLTVKVTPTQQVVNMLTEMKSKGQKMMAEEEKTYQTYAAWVHDTSLELSLQIKGASAKLEELTAFIASTESKVAERGREIAALEGEISRLEADKAQATRDRQAQKAEYLKVSVDYAESVDALQRAIQQLSTQNYDRAQAEVLLQRLASSSGAAASAMPRVLAALQQQEGRGGSRRQDGAPEVAAYEFQSGNVVEVLENLLDKFKQELDDTNRAEANQAHAFSMIELHLTSTIKRDASDRDEKAVAKGKHATELGAARGELAQVQADKAADVKLQADTQAAFSLKTSLFHENQQVRVAELEAIGKAVEIISSPAVQASYAKHINFAQRRGAGREVSLLQVERASRQADALHKASALLRHQAALLKSSTLASMAAAVAANPFAKVIDMVESLLAKLKAEAISEASHKAWCDGELKDNKLRRNKKTAAVNKLQAESEAMAAEIADMGAQIETLLTEQAELAKTMAEATQFRQDEHAKNTEAIADATAGSAAVQQALVILKEFYSAQLAFLQQEPDMKAYKGMQDGKKGILGMLEVIQADFARLKADTQSAEHAAAGEFDTLMKDSEASKKQKHESEVQLKLDKDQREFEKSQTDKDLKGTHAELADANAYYEELKPSCVQVHVSFEERMAGRQAEVEALKEAYAILDQQKAA